MSVELTKQHFKRRPSRSVGYDPPPFSVATVLGAIYLSTILPARLGYIFLDLLFALLNICPVVQSSSKRRPLQMTMLLSSFPQNTRSCLPLPRPSNSSAPLQMSHLL